MTTTETRNGKDNPEYLLKPDANPSALMWMVLLGLPGLLVFLILYKLSIAP